jgi:hypothetical protein
LAGIFGSICNILHLKTIISTGRAPGLRGYEPHASKSYFADALKKKVEETYSDKSFEVSTTAVLEVAFTKIIEAVDSEAAGNEFVNAFAGAFKDLNWFDEVEILKAPGYGNSFSVDPLRLTRPWLFDKE